MLNSVQYCHHVAVNEVCKQLQSSIFHVQTQPMIVYLGNYKHYFFSNLYLNVAQTILDILMQEVLVYHTDVILNPKRKHWTLEQSHTSSGMMR